MHDSRTSAVSIILGFLSSYETYLLLLVILIMIKVANTIRFNIFFILFPIDTGS